MRETVAQGELGVEMDLVVIVVGGGQEGDEQIGVVALGADEGLGVRLAPVELREHLIGRVAAARAVALHLPAPAQRLGRSQEHADVVDVAHGRPVVAEQPLDDGEALRAHVDGGPERPILVAVDGLEDRLAPAQVREMLGDDVEVVAVGVQRGDLELGPLRAVVAVVVIGADVGDVLLAQHPHQAAADRGLAAGRVADDAEDDRPRHHAMSCASIRMSSTRGGRDPGAGGGVDPVGVAQPGALHRVAHAAGVGEPGPGRPARELRAQRLLGGGRELVGGRVEHQPADRHQLLGPVVREIDVVGDARCHARVQGEELLHAVTVSGQDHHQALALVLHHLQQYLDRLNPVVALVLGTVEVVGLVDEEHPAVGALDHLLGLGRGVADVLAHEIVAGHGHHVVALDVPEPVQDLGGAQRHRRLAGARVAGEAHVQRRPGGGEARLAA